MKKTALITIACILMFSGVSFATGMKTSTSPSPTGVVINIHIHFHKPKWDCEKGFGLCFWITWGLEEGTQGSSEKPCPVRLTLDNNKLILEVTESALVNYEKGSTLHYFKDKTHITLDEDTEVPPDICRQLGSSRPIIIKAGRYPVTYANNTYTVVFDL